LKTTHIA